MAGGEVQMQPVVHVAGPLPSLALRTRGRSVPGERAQRAGCAAAAVGTRGAEFGGCR